MATVPDPAGVPSAAGHGLIKDCEFALRIGHSGFDCLNKYGLEAVSGNSDLIPRRSARARGFWICLGLCLVSSRLCLLWTCAPLLGVTCTLVHSTLEPLQLVH